MYWRSIGTRFSMYKIFEASGTINYLSEGDRMEFVALYSSLSQPHEWRQLCPTPRHWKAEQHIWLTIYIHLWLDQIRIQIVQERKITNNVVIFVSWLNKSLLLISLQNTKVQLRPENDMFSVNIRALTFKRACEI